MSGRSENGVDPTYRIGQLLVGQRKQEVVSVPLDADVSAAITRMMAHDYSQLPVMSGGKRVRGVISWKTVAQTMALNKEVSKVRQCLGPANQVRSDAALLAVIPLIAESDYVLVMDTSDQLAGIVTAADLSLEFRHLTEPFLLISEIERHIRKLLEGKLPDSLEGVRPTAERERRFNGVHDLTLGDCIILLQRPEQWERLGLRNIERKIFVAECDHVRQVRNRVMHFHEQGVTDADLSMLRRVAQFVRRQDAARFSNTDEASVEPG